MAAAASLIRLGRWCHRSSPVYEKTCDPIAKGMLADSDNSVWHAAPLRSPQASPPPAFFSAPDCEPDDRDRQESRDWLSDLLFSWHGH